MKSAPDTKALPGNNAPNSRSNGRNGASAPTILLAMHKRLESWRKVGEELGGFNPALCWKVAHGRCKSTRLETALGVHETRTRIAADVSPAQRAALHRMAAAEGVTWSEWCRRLADGYIEEEGGAGDS